ncbi:MAG: M3 family metallopeptidase [Paludibacteraceae bacterium]|nr:M3 family metallopeptidase [Paludibacteraceae bacterium]
MTVNTHAHSHKNPFLTAYDTPFECVPFDKIQDKDYTEALEAGIKEMKANVEAIVTNSAKPTFANTIEALEDCSPILERVEGVLFNLVEADRTDFLDSISEKYAPILTEESNKMMQNAALFARVKQVYDSRNNLNLNEEQSKLLEDTYIGFVRSGALLSDKDKAEFTRISTALSKQTILFGQHVLKDTNEFEMWLEKADLDGLPESAREAAAQRARDKGRKGWLIDLSFPSYAAFMRYSNRRDLREKLYKAYNSKGCRGNDNDNRDLMRDIVNNRLAKAQLMGKTNFAAFRLERNMAENSGQVYHLLDELKAAYSPYATREVERIRQYAMAQGQPDGFELKPWDWAFYGEKLKEELYDINEEQLKPYFELERVKAGVFWVANQLYGLRFVRNDQLPKYHPDVEVYEVYNRDGGFQALFYADFFPRESKRGGAWMTEFKNSWRNADGTSSRPLISIVMNLTPPTGEKPALLTFDNVTTFLHEFGHALHGILSDTQYGSLSGTNVYRDFVELPSQIMENFASTPEFLSKIGIHYQTGEPIPSSFIDKIKQSENFNVAYACIRQLNFAYLDMAWHTMEEPFEGDVFAFEQQVCAATSVFDPVPGTAISPCFNHLFSGGYAAGYYSYKWSEVLDADAFAVFKKNGIFDSETAAKFEVLLSKGGTRHPMLLYRQFKGGEPTIDALLERNGIKR